VAALAALSGEMLTLRAELIAEDGSLFVDGSGEGTDGALIAAELAADLLARAPSSVRSLFAP
jgi:hydroxymethylbilane synthase